MRLIFVLGLRESKIVIPWKHPQRLPLCASRPKISGKRLKSKMSDYGFFGQNRLRYPVSLAKKGNHIKGFASEWFLLEIQKSALVSETKMTLGGGGGDYGNAGDGGGGGGVTPSQNWAAPLAHFAKRACPFHRLYMGGFYF